MKLSDTFLIGAALLGSTPALAQTNPQSRPAESDVFTSADMNVERIPSRIEGAGPITRAPDGRTYRETARVNGPLGGRYASESHAQFSTCAAPHNPNAPGYNLVGRGQQAAESALGRTIGPVTRIFSQDRMRVRQSVQCDLELAEAAATTPEQREHVEYNRRRQMQGEAYANGREIERLGNRLIDRHVTHGRIGVVDRALEKLFH